MPPIPVRSASVMLLGAVGSLIGTYWDFAWHTDKGRDTFWSPPHLLLYAGMALVGFLLGVRALQEYRRQGRFSSVMHYQPLALALLGTAATLAGAPVDDFWHVAFGRDSVVWSPPHMLGLVGSLVIASSVLLEVRRLPGRVGRSLTALASAAVLATALIVTFEYDADVPQFAVFWYLPVTVGATTIAFQLHHMVGESRWPATTASAVNTGLMTFVVLLLVALGHSHTMIPVIAVRAIIFDIGRQRRSALPAVAASYTAAVYLTYVLYLNFVLNGVYLGWAEILGGAPLAGAICWGLLAATAGRPVPGAVRKMLTLALAMVLAATLSTPALAHDPGQGEVVGAMRVRAVMTGNHLQIDGRALGLASCAPLTAEQVTARRAGRARHGSLRVAGDCAFEGTITLPERGRWFVYLELVSSGETLEAWMPVTLTSTGAQSSEERTVPLYLAARPRSSWLQVGAGVVLYAVNFAFLGAIVLAFRRVSPSP